MAKMKLARGLAWNYGSYAVEAIVGLGLVAFVVRRVGVPEYGVLTLALAIASLLTVLDLGLLGLLVQAYVGERRRGGPEAVGKLASSALSRLFVAGLCGFVLCAGIAALFPGPFTISVPLVSTARSCLLLVGLALVVTLPTASGMRVIAIDCDIRVGRLHKLFGLAGSPGLMEVVLGEVSLADAVHATHVENLSVLTAGRNPPNATELLGSDVVRGILRQLNTEFDLLVIDTPPVLATADASVLGSMVGGVIVVIRVGVTDRAAAKRAVDRMRATGARVAGTVLNDPDEVLGSREDYYQYHYGYSTGRPHSLKSNTIDTY